MKITFAIKLAVIVSGLSLVSCDMKSSSRENTSRPPFNNSENQKPGDDETFGRNIGNTSAGLSLPPSMNGSNGSTAGQSGAPAMNEHTENTGTSGAGHEQH